MQFDVAIVGAGPAGLSVARALTGAGLRIGLIERSPRSVLADPPFDGREIALTHLSARLLREFDVWERIPAAEISPLGEAQVLNGGSGLAVRFAPQGRQGGPLGQFAPNHLIRRALFEAVMAAPDVTLLDAVTVTNVETSAEAARVHLADGREIAAGLVVAADTRFSEIRRRQGIGAHMHDFGKSMMVCRMEHERPHHAIATEWFGHGITMAMLPLNGNMSGAVITLPGREVERLMGLEEAAFGEEITARYGRRLGAMRLVGTRHAYPLVGVYAHRFVATRLALAGDAAVGMHPVTAHGFNFGLRSADRLGREIRAAVAKGREPSDADALRRYENGHRADTWPLFTATNAIAQLYTDERLPARVARDALLGLGAVLAPLRRMVSARLMDESGRRPIPLPLPG